MRTSLKIGRKETYLQRGLDPAALLPGHPAVVSTFYVKYMTMVTTHDTYLVGISVRLILTENLWQTF
jgi:hypothetical protein